MKKKFFLASLAMAVSIPAVVAPVHVKAEVDQKEKEEFAVFTDVLVSHPNFKEIMALVNRGTINGFSDMTFRPNQKLNRAEFAAFVARSLDLPAAESNFKDVGKSTALYDGVSRAYAAGIIKGFSDGRFQPNTPVNRQDMAVMIDRAMQLKGAYTKTKTLDFADKAKIGAYAKKSVERLYYYNVMGTYKGANYEGTTVGTRADTAVVIYNMLQVLEGKNVDPPKVDPVEPPTNSPFPQNPAYKETIVLKGFLFRYEHGSWIDENGVTWSEKSLLNPQLTMGKGRHSFRSKPDEIIGSSLRNFDLAQAQDYIFLFGMDFEKKELLDVINQVRQTRKPVTAKDYYFYITPDQWSRHKDDITIELR